jgi:hypothetical protein
MASTLHIEITPVDEFGSFVGRIYLKVVGMRRAFRCFAVAACVLLVSAFAIADQITGSLTGLTNPTCTLTFDDLGAIVDHSSVTQYAAVSFSGFGWDDGSLGQAGSIGFSGGNLVNGYFGWPTDATMSIRFATVVNAAAFAAVDEGTPFTVQAYLDDTLVDTMMVNVPNNPGVGYIGFSSETFNKINITRNIFPEYASALSIDNLQFICGPIDPGTCAGPGPAPGPGPGPDPDPDPTPRPDPDPGPIAVPEPASLLLFGSGISSLAVLLRKKIRK